MLYTVIEKNSYMDSIALMLLTNKINELDGIKRATVMMGTPANKEIMESSGFGGEALQKAAPSDMVIVYEAEDETVFQSVKEEIEKTKKGPEKKAQNQAYQTAASWAEAKETAEQTNLCLISVPGEYAADEAEAALRQGKNVLLFSDNVSVDDEARLKRLAREKGLLLMGPDCGTAIVKGVPLAFANNVRRGRIGIAGASGTGIQELTVELHRLGEGVSHAIGTGGRDLSEAVGAITMTDAIKALERDPETEVIVVVSKPPAKAVKEKIQKQLTGLKKPSVLLMMGEAQRGSCNGVNYVYTLREAAEKAAEMLRSDQIEADQNRSGQAAVSTKASTEMDGVGGGQDKQDRQWEAPLEGAALRGYFSGGTLAYEAAMLAKAATEEGNNEKSRDIPGCLLKNSRCEILDLGDDAFTRGKPHPMMDGTQRRNKILELLEEEGEYPVVALFDIVLGYGASKDPAGEVVSAVEQVRNEWGKKGRAIRFVANLCGTELDPQSLQSQRTCLESAGVKVFESNFKAVSFALGLMGTEVTVPGETDLAAVGLAAGKLPDGSSLSDTDSLSSAGGSSGVGALPRIGAAAAILEEPVKVLNIGVKGFAEDLADGGNPVVHFDWKPSCGGDRTLRRAVDYINNYRFTEGSFGTIEEANQAVIGKITESAPFLVDVVPAREGSPLLAGKVLFHAGPPILWENMTSPMQGSCIGAVLFEGWADTEGEALSLLESGEITFMPCHHAGFVGPMGGITSGSMPVLKVVNRAGGNTAYCTMNEGIGPVLRFGAYSPDVIERLRFMRDTLGPVLSQALKTKAEGININVMISKAVAMGDEFHQRNIAASLVFLKEVAPIITGLDIDNDKKAKVIQFLADTDQFFLNIMMASAKAVMDYARTVTCGTVVTAMTRNGENFGIRISGMKDQWFTAPVNTPDGLYFAGYSREDANPDIGDSAITETFGVGGMAMIAAPAVTRFVGSGGFYDALETSNQMSAICLGHNGAFPVPTWDFKGICLGIDSRKVSESGITPVINTGIAHKKAGLGQIGAGTVRPPVECFTKAVLAYAKELGFQEG